MEVRLFQASPIQIPFLKIPKNRQVKARMAKTTAPEKKKKPPDTTLGYQLNAPD